MCRKLSEKLAAADHEKAYTAGLLHDIGFMVNCVAFSEGIWQGDGICIASRNPAARGGDWRPWGSPIARRDGPWRKNGNWQTIFVEVIACHHTIEQSQKAQPLVALVHLSDLLCRMRDLGYGYYERHKVDLISDPAWSILLHEHRDLAGVDLVRFTFELDEAVEEIHALVATVFGAKTGGTRLKNLALRNRVRETSAPLTF